jgi:polyisoprenoid-binding protein YceI
MFNCHAMKKYILIVCCLLLVSFTSQAQRFITKTGQIKFYSDSPLEKIEAHDRQVNAALDATTGDFVFKVLIKSFEFEKALMQEHFNENYLESDKFPNATFLGKVINNKEINTSKDGVFEVMVEGKLTIHGTTRQVKTKGIFEIKGEKIGAKAKFSILLADYNIKIPGAVTNSISKSIEITVDMVLDKLN